MVLHGSCAARNGDGVLLVGPPGAGKSDLLLRLLHHGFHLVADDQVVITRHQAHWVASAPENIAGLLEVRGLGVFRLPCDAQASLALVVRLGGGPRLPEPDMFAELELPAVTIPPFLASSPHRVALALDCALGRIGHVAGAFA